MTWEESVDWLRSNPDQQDLVRACYFDDPLCDAAQRFVDSEEWASIVHLLGESLPGKVLDLGAGRGIATYAFASRSCEVTSLEPDPSPLVGRGAISSLLRETGMEANVVAASGEDIPCANETFDIVYGRAVLHHAKDLERLCFEAARVLRKGGVFLGTREHVISRQQDLSEFLANHALHALYGGESAYLLDEYLGAMRKAGFAITQVLGPFDTPINYAPMSRKQIENQIQRRLSRLVGESLASHLANQNFVAHLGTRVLSMQCKVPGRHYSFLAHKK